MSVLIDLAFIWLFVSAFIAVIYFMPSWIAYVRNKLRDIHRGETTVYLPMRNDPPAETPKVESTTKKRSASKTADVEPFKPKPRKRTVRTKKAS